MGVAMAMPSKSAIHQCSQSLAHCPAGLNSKTRSAVEPHDAERTDTSPPQSSKRKKSCGVCNSVGAWRNKRWPANADKAAPPAKANAASGGLPAHRLPARAPENTAGQYRWPASSNPPKAMPLAGQIMATVPYDAKKSAASFAASA